MASYNTARHFNIDHLVGAIAPGRYADVVLLSDVNKVEIDRVYANGRLAAHADDGAYVQAANSSNQLSGVGKEYHECGEAGKSRTIF